ncbi:MAG: hypothetical protein RMY29_008905 [Nostoc sp. CreGUA01]|nr:hypothetical protein [Nostoc sp. CreGUA01]
MSENIKSDNSQWLRDLSAEEQEALTAGQITNIPSEDNFFVQKTNTETTANNTLKLANGDISSQKTKFISSQFTLAYSINLRIPNLSSSSNLVNNSLENILNKIFTKR